MKKTRRTILFLESLENRVVPSNTQALLDADHGAADASTMVAEMEAPRMETELREADVSETAKTAKVSDDMFSSASEKSNVAETKEHTDSDQATRTDSDQAGRGDKSMKTADEGSSEDAASSIGATITTSSESAEARTADLTNVDSSKKVVLDSGNSKAKDSTSDLNNSSLADPAGSSIADSDLVSGSKSNSNNSSTKDRESTSSSSGSQAGTGLTDRGATADTGDVTGSASTISKNVDGTGTSLVTDKTNHGKSTSDHKDAQGSGNSTNTPGSTDGIQNVIASDIVANQSKLSDTRLTATSSESTPSTNESVGAPAVGFALEGERGTAAFSSAAAIITAKEAGLNLPRVAEAAIPLAVPVLESLTPQRGLGELGDWSTLAAAEGLAPVAGDLIVGFLPVEQVALGPAMQGVLNQIDELGEQLVGSSAAKWLYPFIFTALAATTLYQLASRRRRQFRGQSVWARDGGSWSSTWFPFLGSSIQE